MTLGSDGVNSGFVIGCDVGTQSTKGILVADDGTVRAVASASYDVSFPAPGWAEQEATDWTRAVADVLTQLTAKATGSISHIGIDAQVDGVVATGTHHEPLHPAIIWMDRRAVSHTAIIEQELGADHVFAITGLNCDSSHPAPKMMWILESLEQRPDHFLSPASVVSAWLTGEIAQDHANASSSMLFDVTQREWSQQMLEVCGIDQELLAPVVDSTDVIGRVRPELAARLGLSSSSMVVAGTGDDHAAAVGAGAARPGVVADVSGTAEPIGVAADHPVFDPAHLVETHAHAVPGAWFIENPGFVSGGSTMWVAQLLGIDQSVVFQLAADAPPGSKGLVFIPALSGAMAPRWNHLARASFSGASMGHGQAEWCRSVLEGCTFALRDNVDRLADLGLEADQLHVTGGGARSDLWLQLKADVTGRPVRAVEGEGAAVGAACLAAVASGWFPDVGAASDALVTIGDRTYEPDQALAPVYEEAYHAYWKAFDALEPTYAT
jgi:xylulokinase